MLAILYEAVIKTKSNVIIEFPEFAKGFMLSRGFIPRSQHAKTFISYLEVVYLTKNQKQIKKLFL